MAQKPGAPTMAEVRAMNQQMREFAALQEVSRFDADELAYWQSQIIHKRLMIGTRPASLRSMEEQKALFKHYVKQGKPLYGLTMESTLEGLQELESQEAAELSIPPSANDFDLKTSPIPWALDPMMQRYVAGRLKIYSDIKGIAIAVLEG